MCQTDTDPSLPFKEGVAPPAGPAAPNKPCSPDPTMGFKAPLPNPITNDLAFTKKNTCRVRTWNLDCRAGDLSGYAGWTTDGQMMEGWLSG